MATLVSSLLGLIVLSIGQFAADPKDKALSGREGFALTKVTQGVDTAIQQTHAAQSIKDVTTHSGGWARGTAVPVHGSSISHGVASLLRDGMDIRKEEDQKKRRRQAFKMSMTALSVATAGTALIATFGSSKTSSNAKIALLALQIILAVGKIIAAATDPDKSDREKATHIGVETSLFALQTAGVGNKWAQSVFLVAQGAWILYQTLAAERRQEGDRAGKDSMFLDENDNEK